jgi:hypothetical protein
MAEPDSTNVPGMMARLGERLIGALPPAFVMLLVINVVFLTSVLWFESHSQEQRATVMNRRLDVCLPVLDRSAR